MNRFLFLPILAQFSILASISLVISGGCRPGKPIEVSEQSKPADLMIAGIVVEGERALTIKVVGKRETVLSVEDSIYEFARSWRFSTREVIPEWTVPEGWKKIDNQDKFSVATFEIPSTGEPGQTGNQESKRDEPGSGAENGKSGKSELEKSEPVESQGPLRVTVSVVNAGQQSPQETIALNINRWRGQMRVNPVVNTAFDDKGREIRMPVAPLIIPHTKQVKIENRIMYFDRIEGRRVKKRTPSKKMIDRGMGDAFKSTSRQSDKGTGASSTKEPELPFTFTAPESWKSAQPNSVAFLRYEVAGDPSTIVSVSRFPQKAVSWQATVGMWQGQLKLPVTKDQELQEITQQLKTDQFSAQVIELQSAEDSANEDNDPAKKKIALVGVMIPFEQFNYFVKLQGTPEVVKAESESLESFVKSIRFKGSDSSPKGSSGEGPDQEGKKALPQKNTENDPKEKQPGKTSPKTDSNPDSKNKQPGKSDPEKSSGGKTNEKTTPKDLKSKDSKPTDSAPSKPAEKSSAEKSSAGNTPGKDDSARKNATGDSKNNKKAEEAGDSLDSAPAKKNG